MTKFLRRIAASVGILAVVFLGYSKVAQARITGTNPNGSSADEFCVGKYNAEICVDYLGDIIPTTANTQTLGTSALPYSALFVSGNITEGTAGTTNSSGVGGTAASQSIISGINVYGKVAVTGIVASTSIPVNSSYESLMSTSNTTVSITALPSISTTTVPLGSTELPSGTYLVLTSTGPSGVVLFDEGTLTGTRLQLGAATRTITQFDTLTLIYDAVDHFWREISYGNN